MTREDEDFFKSMMARQNPVTGDEEYCQEDQFEEVMYFFEETAQSKQPFAAVDNPPVIPFEEMQASFDETLDGESRRFAEDIYEHWKARRLENVNHPLMTTLKVS